MCLFIVFRKKKDEDEDEDEKDLYNRRNGPAPSGHFNYHRQNNRRAAWSPQGGGGYY